MICSKEGCDRTLAFSNRSGFCKSHGPERHSLEETAEKRVIEKPMNVAGYSMAQGLTMQISLPREPWSAHSATERPTDGQ